MPDDRFIHPKLGHNYRVCELSWFERCVWMTYLLAADDFGVMRCSAVTIREADDKIAEESEAKVTAALNRIVTVGLVQTFTDRGRLYCFHAEWQNYQRIRHPRGTLNPMPPHDQVETCTPATQKLFAKHALFRGGFLPGQPDISRSIPEKLPQDDGDAATETPLAVSRKPLAISREPAASEHAAPLVERPDHPTKAQLRSYGTLVAPPDLHVYRHGPHDVTTKTHIALRQKASVHLGSDDDAEIDRFLNGFYDATEAQWRAVRRTPGGKSWEVWLTAYDAAYAGTGASDPMAAFKQGRTA